MGGREDKDLHMFNKNWTVQRRSRQGDEGFNPASLRKKLPVAEKISGET